MSYYIGPLHFATSAASVSHTQYNALCMWLKKFIARPLNRILCVDAARRTHHTDGIAEPTR